MTRWLFILLLCSCFVNIPAEAGAPFADVPKCKGIEHGKVTFIITPNGGVTFYLADRPMPQVTSSSNLICSFELEREAHIESEDHA